MFKKILLASTFFFTSCLPIYAISANPMIYIDDLNKMSEENFESTLSQIFEKAPWIIQKAGEKRPYKGFADLYEGIISPIKTADPKVQLSLIQSYPDLACKGIRPEGLTAHSQSEQSSSGLNQCTQQEAEQLVALNKDYKEKFGFPFMLSIKGFTKPEIIEQFKMRIKNNRQQEFDTSLQQIYKVVMWRLTDTVK